MRKVKVKVPKPKPNLKSKSNSKSKPLQLQLLRPISPPPATVRRRGSFVVPPLIQHSATLYDDLRDLSLLRSTYCWLVNVFSPLSRSPRGKQAMFEFYFGNNEIILRLLNRGLISPRGPPFGHVVCKSCPRPPRSFWPFVDSRVMHQQKAESASKGKEMGLREMLDWDCQRGTFHIAKRFSSEWEFLEDEDEDEAVVVQENNDNDEEEDKFEESILEEKDEDSSSNSSCDHCLLEISLEEEEEEEDEDEAKVEKGVVLKKSEPKHKVDQNNNNDNDKKVFDRRRKIIRNRI